MTLHRYLVLPLCMPIDNVHLNVAENGNDNTVIHDSWIDMGESLDENYGVYSYDGIFRINIDHKHGSLN